MNPVYLTKLISNDTLEILNRSIDALINIGIFVLATKSIHTARTTARKLADNGVISVLFQIEIIEGTEWLQIDSDRVIFPLGSVFYLESIDQATDGVWYVKIKPADLDFRFIKDQMQLEIGVSLSWLTYGNYLYFLKQSREAKNYFEFLHGALTMAHADQSSDYDNMVLTYTLESGKDDKTKAEKIYDNVLKDAKFIESHPVVSEYNDQIYNTMPIATMTLSKTNIDYSTVVASIAGIYYEEGKYILALDHYKQALKLSTNVRYRSYYQQRIETINELNIKV